MSETVLIFKSLWRSKLGPLLVVLQLAVSIALVSNAIHFISLRVENVNRPTGIDADHLTKIWIKQVDQSVPLENIIRRDLELIKSLPGVVDAAPFTFAPHSSYGRSGAIYKEQSSDGVRYPTNYYDINESALTTLGMRLLRGRNFNPEEIHYAGAMDGTGSIDGAPSTNLAIVTQALAEAVFPGGDALGKTVYQSGFEPTTIIGVVESTLGSDSNNHDAQMIMFLPFVRTGGQTNYVIRSRPEDRSEVLLAAQKRLKQEDYSRVVADPEFISDVIEKSYLGDWAMIKLLGTVVVFLIFVNTLGIIGLTTFRINQRKRQIGIRRALGATKLNIMRYFLIENILLFTVSCTIGLGLSFYIGGILVRDFQLQPMPLSLLTGSAVAVFVIVVLSAWSPAWRATKVSPAVATASP